MLEATRQLDLLPPEALAARNVDIVGVGGTGSWTALLLAKMTGGADGFSMRLIDADHVSEHNVPSQFYCCEDAAQSKLKVEACAEHLSRFADTRVQVLPAFLDGTTPYALRDIVIFATDSMQARATCWEDYVADNPSVTWLVDSRTGAEKGTVIAVRVHDREDAAFYQSTLYTDAQAVAEPCTARAIVYGGCIMASLLTRALKRILLDQPVERRLDYDLANLDVLVDDREYE